MFQLWCLADGDLLAEGNTYRLSNTGAAPTCTAYKWRGHTVGEARLRCQQAAVFVSQASCWLTRATDRLNGRAENTCGVAMPLRAT